MSRSKGMTRGRGLAMMAMLFGAMVAALLLPAYGQEVDPTWYNPWAAPNTAVVHPTQPQMAMHRHRATIKHVSTGPSAAKLRGKQTTSRQRPS